MTTSATTQKPILIGLTGFARSGKDSVGRILTDGHGFRRVAFGDTLKAIAEDLNPLIEFTGPDGSNTNRVRVADLLATHGGWEGTKDAVPESRQFLVDLGNSLRLRIPGVEISASFGVPQPGDRMVNTNVYHPEEIDAIRAMGGVVVRVRRPDFGPANPDEANTGNHPVDATVVNDGDFDALSAQVSRVLRGLGIESAALVH